MRLIPAGILMSILFAVGCSKPLSFEEVNKKVEAGIPQAQDMIKNGQMKKAHDLLIELKDQLARCQMTSNEDKMTQSLAQSVVANTMLEAGMLEEAKNVALKIYILNLRIPELELVAVAQAKAGQRDAAHSTFEMARYVIEKVPEQNRETLMAQLKNMEQQAGL